VNLSEILDIKAITQFRRLFYEYTRMVTSFSFPEPSRGEVNFFPSNARPMFCRIIQRSPGGFEACQRSHRSVADTLLKKGKPVVYACHAGITGIAAPVFFEGECQVALLAENILTHHQTKSRFHAIRRKLKEFDINFEELEKAYFELPVVSQRDIRLAIETLSLIVNYIVDREQIIALQENLCQKQEEITNSVMVREQIEDSLQEKVNEIKELRKVLLVGRNPDGVALVSDDPSARQKRVVKSMCAFIDQYYATGISLSDVAEHVGLSPSYATTLFRQECGITFMDYLVIKRINRACELFRDSDMNVSEIGMRVGYHNMSHFNRIFKRIVGMSPGEYRNRIAFGQDEFIAPASIANSVN